MSSPLELVDYVAQPPLEYPRRIIVNPFKEHLELREHLFQLYGDPVTAEANAAMRSVAVNFSLLLVGGLVFIPFALVFRRWSWKLSTAISIAGAIITMIACIRLSGGSGTIEWVTVLKFAWINMCMCIASIGVSAIRGSLRLAGECCCPNFNLESHRPHDSCLARIARKTAANIWWFSWQLEEALQWTLLCNAVGITLTYMSALTEVCSGRAFGNGASHIVFGLAFVLYGVACIALSLNAVKTRAFEFREACAGLVIGVILVVTQHGWPYHFFETAWNETDISNVGTGAFFVIAGLGGLLFTSRLGRAAMGNSHSPNIFPTIALLSTATVRLFLWSPTTYSSDVYATFAALLSLAGIGRLFMSCKSLRGAHVTGTMLVMAGTVLCGAGDGALRAAEQHQLEVTGYILILAVSGLGVSVYMTCLFVVRWNLLKTRAGCNRHSPALPHHQVATKPGIVYQLLNPRNSSKHQDSVLIQI
ncbi:hypothetical protein CAOG_01518 [Capsaspora owczarzaki ATCC 30864]|uniref:Uncharacterized protein n=1 Tax=Capsaspora owczarzaki (strain ATCC 30864) TaxID=595528 RepID=A0A0D2VJM1_CAPO3|nr:hypothetical protein CAOG_01518 [Capsaspora owczarzaki ATCC 30864]KJE90172.1 hypothetical protein CAOG_001518 [Capsaspora owczarzaki ATCC 30864]|eukprot:XP_004364386.1 hypothetical protein CAOG_01518 [Capsaspora owczarzaki ATCC 30864]